MDLPVYDDDGNPISFPEYVAGDQSPRPRPVSDPVSGVPSFLADDWDDETPPVEPELLCVEGGKPLLYAGESHAIFGPGGEGKSWTTQHLAAETLRNDPTAIVVFVDYESNRRTLKERMKALGVDKEQAKRLGYWSTSESLMKASPSGRRWLNWVDAHKPSLVIIDSVAKACAAAQLNDESNPEFQAWDNGVIMPLTERRITSVRIDHTGNDSALGGKAQRERGASSKQQTVSGASYRFELISAWTRTSSGSAKLIPTKDREGHRKKGEVAALMHVAVANNGAQVEIRLTAPDPMPRNDDGSARFTVYMEKVSKLLEDSEKPMSKGQLEKAAGMGAAYCREAIERLAREGFIQQSQSGQTILNRSLKPYRQAADPAVVQAADRVAPAASTVAGLTGRGNLGSGF